MKNPNKERNTVPLSSPPASPQEIKKGKSWLISIFAKIN